MSIEQLPAGTILGPNGEVIVGGPDADNAAYSSNPVGIGLLVDETARPTRDEGDISAAVGTPEGQTLVVIEGDGGTNRAAVGNYSADAVSTGVAGLRTLAALFAVAPDTAADRLHTLGDTAGAGLGVLAVGARTPGSSEIQTLIATVGATSASRTTLLTPTSGKKIRMLSAHFLAFNLSTDPDAAQLYFGTGAAITTNPTSVIGEYDTGTDGDGGQSWPDGEGPIGGVNEVVSFRTETETETGLRASIQYREE